MRTRDENEDLLWETGRVAGREVSVEPFDEELGAYREGRLRAQEAKKVEVRLAWSTTARRRLAVMANLDEAHPAPRIRESVLAAYDATLGRGRPSAAEPGAAGRTGEVLRSGRAGGGLRHPKSLRTLLQMAAVLVVVFVAIWLARSPDSLPPDLTYDVEAEGLATVRQPPPRGQQVDAYADTPVRITASPRPAAVQEVEFGLYRQSGSLLERLDFGSDIRLEVHRGAAVVTARAGRLANPTTRVSHFFLVAARPGDLPARFEAELSDARSLLEDEGRRRAYPLGIRLLETPPSHE